MRSASTCLALARRRRSDAEWAEIEAGWRSEHDRLLPILQRQLRLAREARSCREADRRGSPWGAIGEHSIIR